MDTLLHVLLLYAVTSQLCKNARENYTSISLNLRRHKRFFEVSELKRACERTHKVHYEFEFYTFKPQGWWTGSTW